jgi:hypothetical protein
LIKRQDQEMPSFRATFDRVRRDSHLTVVRFPSAFGEGCRVIKNAETDNPGQRETLTTEFRMRSNLI